MDQLDNLSKTELGILFPITISAPNAEWAKLFKIEKIKIENVFNTDIIKRIEHIGSTAVPGLCAKPIIDILIEVSRRTNNQHLIKNLQLINYRFIPQPENPPPHMMFVKGYTIKGYVGQAYHIHIRYQGDWEEIYFRDYLIKNPGIAREYEVLKFRLASLFKNDREAYTDAKTGFIKKITQIAKD